MLARCAPCALRAALAYYIDCQDPQTALICPCCVPLNQAIHPPTACPYDHDEVSALHFQFALSKRQRSSSVHFKASQSRLTSALQGTADTLDAALSHPAAASTTSFTVLLCLNWNRLELADVRSRVLLLAVASIYHLSHPQQ